MSSQWMGSKPPNADQVPVVTSILKDFSAEALGELRTWLEQNPPAISVQNIIGYQTNTVRVYKKSQGTQTVVNTTTETTVVSEVIPGGTMGTTGAVRVTLLGDYRNNSGALRQLIIRVKLGGTTLVGAVNSGVPAGGLNRRAASTEAMIANTGTSGAQIAVCYTSDLATSTLPVWQQQSPQVSAIDTSIAQTLEISVQHDLASANVDFQKLYYMIEFI